MFKSGLCHILVVHLQQGSPTLTLYESCQDNWKSSGCESGSSVDSKKEPVGWHFWCVAVNQFNDVICIGCIFCHASSILDKWKALHPIGLCLFWLRVTIFSLAAILIVQKDIDEFIFPCGCYVHQWGLNHWGLPYHYPMEYILGSHMCLLVMACCPL